MRHRTLGLALQLGAQARAGLGPDDFGAHVIDPCGKVIGHNAAHAAVVGHGDDFKKCHLAFLVVVGVVRLLRPFRTSFLLFITTLSYLFIAVFGN